MKFNISVTYLLNNNTELKEITIKDANKIVKEFQSFNGEQIEVIKVYENYHTWFTWVASSVLNVYMIAVR